MINNGDLINNNLLYNSPLEVALRTLVLLNNASADTFDIDRLIIFDYIVLHAKDLDERQKNLHPSLPFRSSEIIIRRKLIIEGLEMLVSRGLVNITHNQDGIFYQSNKTTKLFLELLNSNYSIKLRNLSEWALSNYGMLSTQQLVSLVNDGIQLWGSEFEYEALVRGNYGQ
ncbi:ABC-three component system middle component 2 [Mesobacillus maritimus]|uniref:Threonine transporter n=1 Tax=Mesobacillus maritimus TaxID=1643336 RepID=A0ABS7K8W4_9BACI|nr:ABC-three component system middle component 2 [Mesobacillus maritimus]MBY0098706.1 hypothetical protein [Mesobacillus maritimus]